MDPYNLYIIRSFVDVCILMYVFYIRALFSDSLNVCFSFPAARDVRYFEIFISYRLEIEMISKQHYLFPRSIYSQLKNIEHPGETMFLKDFSF